MSIYPLAANLGTPGTVLNSQNDSGISFIDSLIDKEQKIAISQYVVQQYLQEIWQGHLQWKLWQFALLLATFLFLPPVWFIFSIPVNKGLNKVPVIKVRHCCSFLNNKKAHPTPTSYVSFSSPLVHVLFDFAYILYGLLIKITLVTIQQK